MKINYLFKVWFLTLIAARLLIWVGVCIEEQLSLENFVQFLPYLLISIFYSFFFSLPSIGICAVVQHYILKRELDLRLSKGLLALTGCILIWLTFFILGRAWQLVDDEVFPLVPCSYSILYVFGTFIFKVRKLYNEDEIEFHAIAPRERSNEGLEAPVDVDGDPDKD